MKVLDFIGLRLYTEKIKGYITQKINSLKTATTTESGLMSASDKKKLDDIAEGATNTSEYTLPLASSSDRGGVKTGYTANGRNYPVELSDEQMYVNVPWTDTDTNTWQANSSTNDGYVTKSEGQYNKVWGTDSFGKPSWRTPAVSSISFEAQTFNDASGATGMHLSGMGDGGSILNRYLRFLPPLNVQWSNPEFFIYCNMNSATSAGIVPSAGTNYANRFWSTDSTGEPSWRTLSVATSSVYGSVKIGYIENEKNYPVKLNSSGQMYVNVPWSDTDTTYSNMTGASTAAAGKAGLVPAPTAGTATRYLRSDGTWQVPPNTTYSAATTTDAGLMSAADKTKLDGLRSILYGTSTPSSAIGVNGDIYIQYS